MDNKFIILPTSNNGVDFENLLIYKEDNKDESKSNYIVIGKIKYLDNGNNIKLYELLRGFLHDLEELISLQSEIKEDISNYLIYSQQLERIELSTMMKHILFTQEGFDFISGKNLFSKSSIPRTVSVECDLGEEIIFGNKYDLDKTYKVSGVNSDYGIRLIEFFDTWETYKSLYFLNAYDLQVFDVSGIEMYTKFNYARLLNFFKSNFPEWLMVHWKSGNLSDKTNKLMQLTDVAYSLSITENTKAKKSSL